LTLLSLSTLTTLISGHGYAIYPMARQTICTTNPNNNIFWPEDGSGISDPQCRAAFQHVFNKNQDAEAARIQFVQQPEFAVMIPSYDQGIDALMAAVPNNICSAHAIEASAQFGDKSGMSIPYAWPATNIKVNKIDTTYELTVDFCATAVHNPSYWEFYLTKPGYNVVKDQVSWDNLDLVATVGNILPVTTSNRACSSSNAYVMTITIPVYDTTVSTLVTRWQRDDPAGECFINCSDIQFSI